MSYKNSEGYTDLTAGIAIKNAMRKRKEKVRIKRKVKHVIHVKNMKLCYIASKLSGDIEENIKNAKFFCKVSASNTIAPIASHVLYPSIGFDDNDKNARFLCRMYGLYILSMCDMMRVFTVDKEISDGMRQEIKVAKRMQIPIEYINITKEDLLNVRDKTAGHN